MDRRPVVDLTDFERTLLVALVEGYAAREGLKDRIRALNEWEIARRSGCVDVSYAQYLEHPARDVVMAGLMALQRLGFVAVWERGVKYDTFVPTDQGATVAVGVVERPPAAEATAASPAAGADQPLAGGFSDLILERLDQIIHLLRSIDAKLGGS
jgi:hypothetical protein